MLESLYREVLIPPAVDQEAFGTPGRARPSWIRVESPTSSGIETVGEESLGTGEWEAISLALERHADLLVVDDRRGRAVARRLGIPIAETVAIFLRAKEAALIPAVKPLLDELLSKGLRLSQTLYKAALEQADESK